MAAIIENHRDHHLPQRPALRLVPAPVPVRDRAGRPVRQAVRPLEVATGVGLEAWHLAAIVVAFMAVMLGALALGNGSVHVPASAAVPRQAAGASAVAATGPTVTVRPGDTYWSVARRLQPSGDVRALVDQLQDLNGSGVLQPGDRLVVPGR